MISETGNKKPSLRQSGFSLVEIVLVLGLIILAGSVVIANFATMADRGDARTTEEILHQSIRDARFLAASERTITRLSFNEQSGSLNIDSDLGAGGSYTLSEDFRNRGRARINFYLVPPAEGLSGFGDAERTRLQTQAVQFAPDRSSTPFVAEIDTGSGTPKRLVFDPFSSLTRREE